MDKRNAMLLEGLSTGVPYSCGGLRFMFIENHPSGCGCRGGAAKILVVALDARWLEPIHRLPPFADARGQQTSLQAMAIRHGWAQSQTRPEDTFRLIADRSSSVAT